MLFLSFFSSLLLFFSLFRLCLYSVRFLFQLLRVMCLHHSPPSYIEIPRVIAAQQQNTAPEVQQYDADPYQPDSDTAANNGRKISHT